MYLADWLYGFNNLGQVFCSLLHYKVEPLVTNDDVEQIIIKILFFSNSLP